MAIGRIGSPFHPSSFIPYPFRQPSPSSRGSIGGSRQSKLSKADRFGEVWELTCPITAKMSSVILSALLSVCLVLSPFRPQMPPVQERPVRIGRTPAVSPDG